MCGIAGQIVKNYRSSDFNLISSTTDMINKLNHRGPDDMNVWQDESLGICFGHKRLSIIDLSSKGRQPMCSADGRYVITFNGEIYNYLELKRELENSNQNILSKPIQWKGYSDTEVMLEAISRWGVYGATKRFTGMFSFALWDRSEKRLYLVRDRIGEKPLYYGWVDGVLLFGSELKALCAHPKWKGEIDRDSLALFMKFNYIPAPYTIYKQIRKLEPGCITHVSLMDKHEEFNCKRYWSIDNTVNQSRLNIDEVTAVNKIESALSKSIERQMIADVPLGAFLSGGIDSSLIVALMQNLSTKPIQTFTVGFHDDSYNEANYAANVARHLGTEHKEFYVTAQDAIDVIPMLPNMYDEPFADSSQIPTYLISKLTRDHVTVSLSGDGADEFFGGYNRYLWGKNIWDRIKIFPLPLRKLIADLIKSPSPQTWDNLFSVLGRFLPNKYLHQSMGNKLHKLSKIVGATSANNVFFELISLWCNDDFVIGSKRISSKETDLLKKYNNLDFTEFMMCVDMQSYLPDDILTKVDRATMSVGLESRAPYLDHELIELAWSLPLDMKIKNGKSKWLLRKILHKYIPKEMIERPKMGFGVPMDSWLRGPLRDWAEDLLSESKLKSDGYLKTSLVREKWDDHISGKRNWQYHLWGVLMFQAWLHR